MDNRPPQSVLVTGASGFIGRHLVRRLIERGDRVFCLTRTPSRIHEPRPPDAQWITGDVTDRASMAQALRVSQAHKVFHLAGLTKTLHTHEFQRVNEGGVESVAAACADCPDKPVLVVVSSLAAAGPCAEGRPLVESDAPAPVSAYGRSKLAGERAAARHAGVVPISIVRPPMVFGLGDSGMLEIFGPIARWGLHAVPGQGERTFSLIHVADLVEGLLLVAEKGERLHPNGSPEQGVYFLAADDSPTYAELGQAIATALKRKRLTVIHLPGPLVRGVGRCCDAMAWIRQRPGWVNSDKITEALAGSWMCLSAKARSDLGWSPAAALAKRLRDTAQWYAKRELMAPIPGGLGTPGDPDRKLP